MTEHQGRRPRGRDLADQLSTEVAEGLRARKAQLEATGGAPSFDEMDRMIYAESDKLVKVSSQTISHYHKVGGSNLEWIAWFAWAYECTVADISPTCARRLQALIGQVGQESGYTTSGASRRNRRRSAPTREPILMKAFAHETPPPLSPDEVLAAAEELLQPSRAA